MAGSGAEVARSTVAPEREAGGSSESATWVMGSPVGRTTSARAGAKPAERAETR
ncbi:MAG: hypothetical protein IPQ24_00920 [Anaeromyxobacter sp.]|nr:hypothetical protein [Anaeromyxobacter sp.]